MIEDYGVSSVGANRLFHYDGVEVLTFSDYEYLLGTIWKLQRKNIPAFFADSFPRCKVSPKYWSFMNNCSQGVAFCQIDYLGNIKNCSSLSVNIGNVFEESLQYIWQHKLAEFRSLKHLPLSCRLCPSFCGGGCIASRGVEQNLLADEFVNLPDDESFFDSLRITAKNYFNLWLGKLSNDPKKKKVRNWKSTDKPIIAHKYKIRREAVDFYLCMIEKKGVVSLNENSSRILKLVDGQNTIECIARKLKAAGLKVSEDDVIEVLSVFID